MDYKSIFSLKGHTAVITGGCGYLGREIVKGFIDYGAEVYVIDYKITSIEPLDKCDRIHYIQCDLGNTEAIKRICTAYLKLLFPNVQHPKDISSHDINLFCLKPAIEMRSIIKIQLGILDPEEFGGKTVPELCVKDIDE